MRVIPSLILTLSLATPALAQTEPPLDNTEVPSQFIDDRSSPERVVTSLYNAIDRREYLRGWSYFAPDTAPDYDTFRDGYETTEKVELRLGEVHSEGAAGSVYSLVPVALRATDADGTETVFAGCYRLTQVQPAAQDTPPFRPIQIDEGKLDPSDQPFDQAMGTCDEP
ncbi:hypothetical protein JJJ17_19800 [Paracoccus caeni]|uniref:DUF1176 domain-containing protein n=1 Tax=Paracoccus caeni TaxID=657651 RepID=A0A934W289_9RHOB|nr:hypothetical protein [Paracoccus caeni]MBK4218178.1 hypothetical protein [Paracoccus caeni]